MKCTRDIINVLNQHEDLGISCIIINIHIDNNIHSIDQHLFLKHFKKLMKQVLVEGGLFIVV